MRVEAVVVDYEPLEVVVDPFEALKDKVIVRDDKEVKTNHIWHWEAGDQDGDRSGVQRSGAHDQAGYLPAAHPRLLD